MADWDQPHWSGRPQPKPDTRPKLRPNAYARLARASAHYHLAVMAFFLIAALLSAVFAAVTLVIDPNATPQVSLDPQTAAAQQSLALHFPAIDSTFLAIVTGENSGVARAAAVRLAATLTERPDLFTNAFVPGTGDFYSRFGFLFHAAADIEARVSLALGMQPLYHALGAAPDIQGLAALVTEIGRAVENGRSPVGLTDMLGAVSGSIEGEIAGVPRPLHWPELAGLAADTENRHWFVIATPVGGAEPAAALHARAIPAASASVVWLWPGIALGAPGNFIRDIAVPAGLAALVVITILTAGLGAVRFAVPVILASLVTTCLAAGAAALINPKLDGVTWSFAAAVLAPALMLSMALVLAHVQARLKGAGVRHAIMLASHRRGNLLAALAAFFLAFWLSWLVRQMPSLSQFAGIAAAGTVIALLMSLTLVPAALAAFDSDSAAVEVHWLDAAIATPLPHHGRNLRQVISMLMIAAGVFCIVFLPAAKFGEKLVKPDTPIRLETPDARGAIHVLAGPGEPARAAVQKLSALPETGAIRWIEHFVPPDAAGKIGYLHRLEGLMPGLPAPRAPADPSAISATFADLEEGLRRIANSPAADQDLRQAALRLRRAAGLYGNPEPPSPGRVLALEDVLFSSLGQLSMTADQLAKLDVPHVADLDEGLRRRFVSRGGPWRIEVMPKPEIGALTFAAAVRKLFPAAAGEPILALARNEIMHHETGLALAAALAAVILLAFVALRDIGCWLLTLLPAAFYFTLSAAMIVSLGLALNSAMLAAASTIAALAVSSAVILAEWAWLTPSGKNGPRDTSVRAGLLPLLVLAGTVAPLAISTNQPVAEFGSAATIFLTVALAVNMLLIPAVAQWLRQSLGR